MRETWVGSLGWEEPVEEGTATHSSILALENPQGQRSLVGCSPWGLKDSDTTEWLSTAQHIGGISTKLGVVLQTERRSVSASGLWTRVMRSENPLTSFHNYEIMYKQLLGRMFACMAWSRRGETGERRRWRKQHVRNPLHREPSRCYHHDDNILIISWKRIKLSTFKRELISPTAIGYVHHFLRIFTNVFLKCKWWNEVKNMI